VAYIVGLEARGLSPNARKYMESGKVKVSEWTNYSLSVRFKAAAAGVSFYPARNIMGTDTFQYSGAKVIECPFTGTKYAAMPAIWPDVSAIHVHEADIYGNCRIRGGQVCGVALRCVETARDGPYDHAIPGDRDDDRQHQRRADVAKRHVRFFRRLRNDVEADEHERHHDQHAQYPRDTVVEVGLHVGERARTQCAARQRQVR